MRKDLRVLHIISLVKQKHNAAPKTIQTSIGNNVKCRTNIHTSHIIYIT